MRFSIVHERSGLGSELDVSTAASHEKITNFSPSLKKKKKRKIKICESFLYVMSDEESSAPPLLSWSIGLSTDTPLGASYPSLKLSARPHEDLELTLLALGWIY